MMQYKDLYEREHAFATQKHLGQLRKDGLPYITHPEEVASDFDDGAEKVAVNKDDEKQFVCFQETATASIMSKADSYCRNGRIDGRSRF